MLELNKSNSQHAGLVICCSQQAGLVICCALHCWSVNARQVYSCTPSKKSWLSLSMSPCKAHNGIDSVSKMTKSRQFCVTLAMLLTVMPYLKKAHISSSPVIDGLITISNNGHPLTQSARAGIAGEGIQQPVLSMRYILELIQLHQKRVMVKLG